MRIAIIGAGGIGLAHHNAYKLMSDVQIVAVVDPILEQASKIAVEYGAPIFATLDEMLEQVTPDMVDICVPSYLHPEVALKCMEKQINVLCEKPIAHDLDSAAQMIETARKQDVHFMIAQVVRFWPEYNFLKKAYEDQTYGELKYVLFSRMCAAPAWGGWYLEPDKSGMAPFELHIHDTDFIHYMFGSPLAVSSVGVEELDSFVSYISTRYLYEEPIVVQAEAGWSQTNLPFTATFRATFEHAVLSYKDDQLTVYPSEGPEQHILFDEEVSIGSEINIKNAGGMFNEIRYFIECVRTQAAVQVVPPQHSYESLNMLLKELESVKTGQIIYI